jgi:hypothetical protein
MRKAARFATHVALRLVLYHGETHRLLRSCLGVRVIEGVAWVTFAGTDFILGRDEETRFQAARDFAVVSPLGATPLVLEVLARSPLPHHVRQARLPSDQCQRRPQKL